MLLPDIAEDLRMTVDELRLAVVKGGTQVKIYRINKSKGGQRRIFVAPKPIRAVQYWLIANVLRGIKIHPAASAYFPKASIVKNASSHKSGNFFVRLDIENFFPSISVDDFFGALEFVGQSDAVKKLLASRDDSELVSCVGYRGKCATGYPITPYISNIVMAETDRKIQQALEERIDDFGAATYTRYADDMVISIENRGFKGEVVETVRDIVEASELGSFKLNDGKTRFASRAAGTATVTGIRICRDGRLTLHRSYKDHVRLLFSLAAKNKLSPSEMGSLLGHLYHCRAIDSNFYNNLLAKHLDLIQKLK